MKNYKSFAETVGHKINKILKEQEQEKGLFYSFVVLSDDPMSLSPSGYGDLNKRLGKTGLKVVLKQTK